MTGTETIQNAQRSTLTWENFKRARDVYTCHGAETGRFQNHPRTLTGFKVVVVLPATVTRRMTFWGSLVGLWRGEGWRREVVVPNPMLPAPGNYWRLGDTLYCREEDYRALKEAARLYQ